MDGSLFPRRFRSSLFVALAVLAVPGIAGESSLWSQLSTPSGGVGTRIAMDPVTPANLFLLVPDKGIYRSTDTGGHWSLDWATVAMLDMDLDPQQPHTLYTMTGKNTVYKTTDAGDHWQKMSDGIPQTVDTGVSVHVIVDPVTEGTVYAVTWQQGVFKTVDGGAHWNAINTGIDSSSSNNLLQGAAGIHSLSIDPMNDQVLYLAAWSSNDVVTGLPGMGIAGIYQSTDGGGHWNQILSGESFWAVGVQPGNDQTLFASGTYHYEMSTDGGAHWNAVYQGPTFSSVFRFNPTNPQQMWVGGMGFLPSSDGGLTWIPPNGDNGTGLGVMDLVADPTGTKLYAAYSGMGASVSSDNGNSWQPLSNGIDDVKISQMMVGDDGTIYLGTAASGLFRGSESGGSWTAIDNGIPGGDAMGVKQIVEDPTTSTLFLVDGLFLKSQDRGDNWSRIIEPLSGDYSAIAVIPGSPSTIYVAQMQGVQKSTDDGDDWTTVNTGLPAPGSDSVPALASSSSDAAKVFAGTYNHGLYMTSDGGAHWSHVGGLATSGVLAVAIDPVHDDTVYAAPIAGGMFKSSDGGTSWSDSGQGLSDVIALICIDPADSDILVAMSETGGRVYLSADAGASWTRLDTSNSAVTRAFVRAGSSATASSTTAPQGPSLATLAMDPKHKGMMVAADKQGNMYKVSVAQLVAGLNKSAASSSSSGGGGMPLLVDLLLLGVLLRRRH